MHQRHSNVILRIVLSLLLLVSPGFAVDEATRAALRDLGTEGVEAYQAGDYATARQKLDEAYSVMRTAPLGLWSARALEKSGLLVQASERYLAAERAPVDPDGDAKAQEEARAAAGQERAALQPRIPRLKVNVTGAEPSEVVLTVGGKEVPGTFVGKNLQVNPGLVEVKVRRGEEEVSGSVEVAEGETKELALTLTGTPGATSATAAQEQPAGDTESAQGRGLMARKWPAFVAAGVAVAGGVLWTVFGVQSMDAKAKADGCTSPCTPTDEANYRQQAWDAGNMATVGMVITGVGLATAGVLWFTLPGADGPKESVARLGSNGTGSIRPGSSAFRLEQVRLGVRPGGLVLRGTF